MMKFYRLNRTPDPGLPEGEDWNEWFTSFEEASRRRRYLIRMEDPQDGDLSIDRVTLAALSPKALVLAILNRRGFIAKRDRIVKPYEKPA